MLYGGGNQKIQLDSCESIKTYEMNQKLNLILILLVLCIYNKVMMNAPIIALMDFA